MSNLRFNFERLLLRGLHYRLLLAAVIIALVSITAGLLVVLLDPGFDDTGEAIWWSFLRLSDPGYLGDDEGVVSVTISTIVTVLGYVVFLGLLVAILTQWMNALIQRGEAGTTPITFEGHILILGWSHRTPSIVLRLLQTGGRVARFLESSGASKLRIVVLDEDVDGEMREELKTSLGKYWDDRRVVLRSGSPLKLDDLERAAFHGAAAVILPGADFATTRPGVADSEVIKTLAAISKAGMQAGHTPMAVAALHNANRCNVARHAYAGDLEAIAADQLVSRTLAQCILQPGLWQVYWELFSLHEDNAVFIREVDVVETIDVARVRRACADAVVIGVIPSKTLKPILNPPNEMQIESGDALIFVARRFADCEMSEEVTPTSKVQTPDWRPVVSGFESVLIIGWSRLGPKILTELRSNSQEHINIDIAALTPADERELHSATPAEGQRSKPVRKIEANIMDPDAAAEIRCETYDAILMIARERMEDEAVADAATISSYMTVETLLPEEDRPHIVAELLEEENAVLIDDDRVDAIVSPTIVSYILSQVALKPELGMVLEEFVQPWGVSVLFRTLGPGSGNEDYSFRELSEQAALRGETAIGVVTSSAGGRRTRLNPGADARFAREEIDQVIVLGSLSEPGQIGG